MPVAVAAVWTRSVPLLRRSPMLPGTPHTFIGSTTFSVADLECAHCRRAITEEVTAVPGVDSVTVDLAAGTVTVTASVPLDRADITAALEEAGHRLLP